MPDFCCRLCGHHQYTYRQSFEHWTEFAQTTFDERAKIAAIIQQDAGLDFGGLVICKSCALPSVLTPPSKQALGRFYDAYYANTMYGAKRDKKIKRARKRLRRLAKLTKGRRFLDVGANLGYAVEGARLAGFVGHGIEIDKTAVAHAQSEFPNNQYTCVNVEDFAQTGAQYDVVYCCEVLEHVIDFVAFSQALLALIAPGGLLYLTTPASDHKNRPQPFENWAEVKPPEHLTWFGRKHLARLFEKPDFEMQFMGNRKPGHKIIVRRNHP